jgi:hypothetical protein
MRNRQRPRYFILEGKKPRPVRDVMTWAQWFEDAERRVAFSVMLDGSEVSTVFLGSDHNHSGRGRPVLFETCVFLHESTAPGTVLFGRTIRQSEVLQRYSTWAEAEVGHMEIVEGFEVPVMSEKARQ